MPRARVKPELVRWVREDAGLSVEDAARKTGTSVTRVEEWEAGTLAPTLRQLRLLGNAARRPLAVFYLPEPPKRFQAMHDFRRLPGDPMVDGSPELRLAIRTAMARREVALELASELEDPPPSLDLVADVREPVQDVAARIRTRLDVPLQLQREWKGPYDALNGWKDAIEAVGVLVFQASGVDVAEMRGFSISDDPLPVIVLNVRDAPNGRVFTLLHEFCHLLLREGGLCDLTDSGLRPPEDDRVEVFCNAVAAETLVAPRRLLDSGRTTDAFYRAMRRQFLEEYEERRTSGRGYSPPDVRAVSYAGHAFVRMVLDSYYRERITSRDVSDYLGVKLKHLGKIEERVMGSRVRLETLVGRAHSHHPSHRSIPDAAPEP